MLATTLYSATLANGKFVKFRKSSTNFPRTFSSFAKRSPCSSNVLTVGLEISREYSNLIFYPKSPKQLLFSRNITKVVANKSLHGLSNSRHCSPSCRQETKTDEHLGNYNWQLLVIGELGEQLAQIGEYLSPERLVVFR